MTNWYNKKGEKVSMEEASKLLGEDKIVKQETIGKYRVSTVFLGLNHRYDVGPPLIFETMVFALEEDGSVNYSELETERYSTEEQALRGHKEIVEKWSKKEE